MRKEEGRRPASHGSHQALSGAVPAARGVPAAVAMALTCGQGRGPTLTRRCPRHSGQFSAASRTRVPEEGPLGTGTVFPSEGLAFVAAAGSLLWQVLVEHLGPLSAPHISPGKDDQETGRKRWQGDPRPPSLPCPLCIFQTRARLPLKRPLVCAWASPCAMRGARCHLTPAPCALCRHPPHPPPPSPSACPGPACASDEASLSHKEETRNIRAVSPLLREETVSLFLEALVAPRKSQAPAACAVLGPLCSRGCFWVRPDHARGRLAGAKAVGLVRGAGP